MLRIKGGTCRRRTDYGDGHIFQLVVGYELFNDAFGDDEDAMLEVWLALREQVFTRLEMDALSRL